MIGRLYRISLAASLALLMVFAPVGPAFAQEQTGPTPAAPVQGPAVQEPPPAVAPVVSVTPVIPPRTLKVSDQDYSKGKHWFPTILAPYTPAHVPEPVLTPAPRIEQMIQDGKLRISLQDAIDLALQDNLDISIQRYAPWIAEANILRTKGGGASRGSLSATGNIPQLSFDPLFTSTLSLDQRAIPVNNPFIAGTGVGGAISALDTHTTTANFALTQGFHTGTSYAITFNNARSSTNSPANLFNPSLTSTGALVISQQLLNGFGLLPNERNIRIAKLNKNVADQTFAQQVITSITAVENAYWELVFARGNVDVALHQVSLSSKLYSDNKKQVDIGTLAPLEIVQAEAQVATANQTLIVNQTTVLQDQLTLLNLISKDPTILAVRGIEIIPTDTLDSPPPVEKIPLADAIKEALGKRPDVLQSAISLKADDLNIRVTRNALLPIVTASVEIAAQGLSGNSAILGPSTIVAGAPVVDQTGNSILLLNSPTGPVPVFIPTTTRGSTIGTNFNGPFSALSQLFRGVNPEYNAGLTLTIPIRNRQAQADNITALLTGRQDEVRYRQVVNNAAIDVHNAQIVLEQARATLAAASKTRDLDQQTLDAEQKKYRLGASTLFNVVSNQNTLATAASAEVRARANLAEAKVNFDRAMGRTMEVNNITISDAQSGQKPKDTLIPGTSPNGRLIVDQNKTSGADPAAANQH